MMAEIVTAVEAIPLIGWLYGFISGICLVIRRDLRLLWNLQRPIMFLGSSSKDMDLVVGLIRDAGFFRLEPPIKADQNLDRLRKHSVVVVAYTAGETKVERIIQATKAKSIPVIFYAGTRDISSKDRELILAYSYAEMANTPFRIMNLIFSILSTHKYVSKGG